jgi:cytochrome c oxidase cbb3-type subunit 1
MWITGIQQGAMWKMTNTDGSLQYTFMETLVRNYPYWQMRTVAGLIFVVGMLFFVYNVLMTIKKGNDLAKQAA